VNGLRFAAVAAAALSSAIAAALPEPKPALASAATIEPGKTVTISTDAPSDPHGESFLAINPKNPANMLAASCRISKGKAGSSAYVSHDGGRTWTRVVLPEGAAKVATGWDAIAYFDGAGNAFYGANDGAGLWITRSSDEGKSWSDATLIAGAEGFDRQYMGFDRTGRFKGRIYAGASVETLGLDGKSRSALAVAYSDDGGKTFGQPTIVTSTPDERIFTFVNMIVTPEGTVILPFTTMPERVMPDWTLWDSHDEIKSLPDYDLSLRLATSNDGGKSYSISPRVARFHVSGDRFRAMNAQGNGNSAIDLSDGPFRGRIYAVGLDNAGDRTDVRVVHSSDGGKTWSKPATVNDNKTSAVHANPTIAVNNRGVVGVVWNDRRAQKNECYDLFFSASLDGGETFVPNVTPGGKATCSMSTGNWAPNAEVSAYPKTEDGQSVEGQGFNVLMISTRFPGGGDTQGLDSDGNGVFHAAWIDGSSGVMLLATTPFSVAGAVVAAPKNERDVSTQVKLVSENCAFDWKANAFGCEMHLVNKSPLPVTGPFAVELQNMMVNLTDFRVENADNQRPGEGARWTFSAPAGSNELSPGAQTAARPFRWRFTGIPEKPEYPFMMFKVVVPNAAAENRGSSAGSN
jgi:photosystem II stability/assembly factor-like uncharacterized protein